LVTVGWLFVARLATLWICLGNDTTSAKKIEHSSNGNVRAMWNGWILNEKGRGKGAQQ